MLQTSCCPFSIGVCAGCWVDVQQFGGGPPQMNLSTKQEAPSSSAGILVIYSTQPPLNALDQVVIVV